MATEPAKTGEREINLKKGAKASLVLLLVYVLAQLLAVYQTRQQLASPLIPESTIWEINKQFIFTASVSVMVSLVALVLYFFDKYLLVIILVGLALIVNRFIYV